MVGCELGWTLRSIKKHSKKTFNMTWTVHVDAKQIVWQTYGPLRRKAQTSDLVPPDLHWRLVWILVIPMVWGLLGSQHPHYKPVWWVAIYCNYASYTYAAHGCFEQASFLLSIFEQCVGLRNHNQHHSTQCTMNRGSQQAYNRLSI